MTAPLVSIVIASYNAARFLEEAVRSALDQTHPAIEIVIADDASTDGTAAIGARLAADHAPVRFLPGSVNAGPGATRNRAIAAASGSWIAILDADDTMLPTRIAVLLEAALRNGADLVADDLLPFADGSSVTTGFLDAAGRRAPHVLTPVAYLEQTVLFGRRPNLGYLKPMIRAQAMRAAGVRYDERLRIGEDDDLVTQLLAAGLRYWIEPTPLYRYRRHAASISHRLTVADLEAMAAAARRLRDRFASADRPVARAVARRTRAVDDALRFQRIVDALKARAFGTAAMHALRGPSALTLMRMPIAARLARFGGSITPITPIAAAPGATAMTALPPTITDVTVCICTFRRASVAETLASVARQLGTTPGTLPVVVVDNDGDDRARARIVDAGTAVGLDVRYVHAPARNISVARNAALAAVATRWAAFIDDDERACRDWLIQLMAARADRTAVIGQARAVYAADMPAWLRKADFHSNRIGRGRVDNAYTSNALLDMAFVRERNLRFRVALGETGGEDTLFFREWSEGGGTVIYRPGSVVEEPVSVARANMRWVLRRRFRAGQVHALMLREFEPPRFRRLVATATAKAAFATAMSGVTILGPTASRRWLARAALHAGAVAFTLRPTVTREYAG